MTSADKCNSCKENNNNATLVLVVPDFGVFYTCDNAECLDTFYDLVAIAKEKEHHIYDAQTYKGIDTWLPRTRS